MKGRQPVACSVTGGQQSTLDLPDAELLERFVTCRDEAAFAALVARHGPMVFGVCRRMLRHAQDAEDAFQATFLVLVRRAGAIGERELVSNWLYGVASRVAGRARLMAARRQTRETPDMERIATAMREPAEPSALPEVIAEEVQRLPAKYRGPVVLCYLEGRTNEEAAAELRWPVGTVKGRLARARELLRKRLTRRDLTLSTAAFSAALLPESLAAPLPSAVSDSTLKAATAFAAGDSAAGGLVSAQAVALTNGVLHTMFLAKIKTLAALVLVLAGLVAGPGLFTYYTLAREPDKKEKPRPDNEAIQGNWEVASIETDEGAYKQEVEQLKSSTWVFEKENFTWKKEKITWKLEKVGKAYAGPYKIDPTKTPKNIDVALQFGERGRMIQGIYKLQGNELTICIPLGQDEPRPTELKAEKGSRQCLIVFKRKKS